MAKAKKNSQISGLPEGVYFNLPFDDYHNDPALGSGDLRALRKSAPDYWYESPLNPQRVRSKTTPARLRGQAMHSMVLEGRQAFDARFVCEPTGSDVLYTIADMTEWLKAHGSLFPKGSKAELAALVQKFAKRLKLKNPPVLYDDFKSKVEASGRIILNFDDYARISIASAMITKNPELATAFTGGVSEVSVFWRRSPQDPMMKCRFDYLKVRGIGDLKAITNTMGVDFGEACKNNFARYRYDIQAAHYLEGRAMLPLLVRGGHVFGKHDKKWLAEVAASKEYAFVFVFFQAEGAPITESFKLSPRNPILAVAQDDIAAALARYHQSLNTFGPHEMWVRIAPTAELDIGELPGYYGRAQPGEKP
jgi:hypothetical protein